MQYLKRQKKMVTSPLNDPSIYKDTTIKIGLISLLMTQKSRKVCHYNGKTHAVHLIYVCTFFWKIIGHKKSNDDVCTLVH